ncbi:MAG: porin [Xanthobacteraceae bacterium]|jgi:outer membrane immunogenic protein|nr:porin [Xanthobacteraceae bacterium]
MKKYLLATVFLGAFLPVSGAYAADMAYPVKAPAPVVIPVFSWTGFYIGVNAGYGGDKFRYPFDGFFDDGEDVFSTSGAFDLTSSGFFGGGQIGYNYQFENGWVIGAEADIQWSGIEGELSGNADFFEDDVFLGGGSFNAGSEVEWFGTIRARLGYAWDKVFLYGTGGAAYGKTKSHYSISLEDDGGVFFEDSASTSDTNWGWTVGAGLEYAITNNLTFKTEYLYVDLGKTNLVNIDGGEDFGFDLDVETKFHTIKAGLNYKF